MAVSLRAGCAVPGQSSAVDQPSHLHRSRHQQQFSHLLNSQSLSSQRFGLLHLSHLHQRQLNRQQASQRLHRKPRQSCCLGRRHRRHSLRVSHHVLSAKLRGQDTCHCHRLLYLSIVRTVVRVMAMRRVRKLSVKEQLPSHRLHWLRHFQQRYCHGRQPRHLLRNPPNQVKAMVRHRVNKQQEEVKTMRVQIHGKA